MRSFLFTEKTIRYLQEFMFKMDEEKRRNGYGRKMYQVIEELAQKYHKVFKEELKV